MDTEHVKGAIDNAVGKTKEVMGQMLGDKELEAVGKIDQVKGAAHSPSGISRMRPKWLWYGFIAL